jgi:Helix-turn-helix domain/RodZ C-terminal domain
VQRVSALTYAESRTVPGRRRTLNIGAELAAARRHANLTVAEVSQRTKIREAIVRDIEADDYTGCGGDFYARGFIRAIARAVGTDPAPLIDEYNAANGTPQAAAAPPGLLGSPARGRLREPRRLNVTALLAVATVIVLAFAAVLALSASRHPPGTGHRHPLARPSATAASPATARHGREVVVSLVAAQPCWIEFTTPAGRYLSQAYVLPGQSKTWTFRHAVAMRLGNPAGVKLTVNGRDPLPRNARQPVTLMLAARGSTR